MVYVCMQTAAKRLASAEAAWGGGGAHWRRMARRPRERRRCPSRTCLRTPASSQGPCPEGTASPPHPGAGSSCFASCLLQVQTAHFQTAFSDRGGWWERRLYLLIKNNGRISDLGTRRCGVLVKPPLLCGHPAFRLLCRYFCKMAPEDMNRSASSSRPEPANGDGHSPWKAQTHAGLSAERAGECAGCNRSRVQRPAAVPTDSVGNILYYRGSRNEKRFDVRQHQVSADVLRKRLTR